MDEKTKRYARYLLVMAGLGGLLYGVDVGVIAAALPYIEKTATYTAGQLGFVVGMVLWGSVFSSLFYCFCSALGSSFRRFFAEVSACSET